MGSLSTASSPSKSGLTSIQPTGKAKNEGTVDDHQRRTRRHRGCDSFDGTVDLAALTVSGKFKVEKKQGTGAYAELKGQGDYTGGAAWCLL